VYERVKAAYEEYLYCTESWYAVHACWDVATYFFNLFPAFPYLELRGVKQSGKSKVMKVSRLVSFNGSPILTSPSEATLFRMVHAQRPTLYIDEAENLFQIKNGKVDHDGRIEVINSGYTADGKVPRVEYLGKKFITVVYSAYCPKMLASINGLHGATESRAIVHIMTRAPDKDTRGQNEPNPHDKRWQALRDELLNFTLSHWKDVLAAYDAATHGTNLRKRDLQLWRPLLAVAALIGADVRDELLRVATQQAAINRGEEFGTETWEFALLQRTYQLLRGGTRIILFRDLRDAITGEKQPSVKAIRSIMDRLGLRDFWIHTEDGNGYRFESIKDFETMIAPIAPHLFVQPILQAETSISCGKDGVIQSSSSSSAASAASAGHEFAGVGPSEMKIAEGTPPFPEDSPYIVQKTLSSGKGGLSSGNNSIFSRVSSVAEDRGPAEAISEVPLETNNPQTFISYGTPSLLNPSRADVLEALAAYYPKTVSIEQLQADFFPGVELTAKIERLLTTGDIYERPAGRYGVLK
jgi:hypothetical protein